MSDFDLIPTLLAAIADECPAAPDMEVFAELTFSTNHTTNVIIYACCPDEFQEQMSPRLDVKHITSSDHRDPWASITVIAGPAEDPIALLECALDFVRTETPVPL